MDSAGIAFPYLKSIEATGLGVRITPIGIMHFGLEPWNHVVELFVTPVEDRYINVVCAPPRLYLGGAMTKQQLAEPPGSVPKNEPSVDRSGVVYKPTTALDGLLTRGMRNVAILTIQNGLLPLEIEVEKLKQYDAVICPKDEDQQILQDDFQVPCQVIPMENVAALRALFDGFSDMTSE